MADPHPEPADEVRTLLEAVGWIRAFRGRYVVVKLGGSALERDDAVESLLTDVRFMEAVGVKPILVHGGGKAIDAAMTAAGIAPRFVAGRRYTDAATMEIVARELAAVSDRLVGAIRRQGGRATALNAPDDPALFAEPLTLTEAGEPVDLGRVGTVGGVNTDLLNDALADQSIPVLPSFAADRSGGGLLNVNADTAAAALACTLRAEKLVFLSDVPGLFADPSDPTSLVTHLTAGRARTLIAEGVIAGGMIPKVEAALEALAAGVAKIHFVDGRVPHSVLLEIYSDRGVGTEVVRG